jgi:hypothetical protein
LGSGGEGGNVIYVLHIFIQSKCLWAASNPERLYSSFRLPVCEFVLMQSTKCGNVILVERTDVIRYIDVAHLLVLPSLSIIYCPFAYPLLPFIACGIKRIESPNSPPSPPITSLNARQFSKSRLLLLPVIANVSERVARFLKTNIVEITAFLTSTWVGRAQRVYLSYKTVNHLATLVFFCAPYSLEGTSQNGASIKIKSKSKFRSTMLF